jgi:ABC-2 type transport system permease protein
MIGDIGTVMWKEAKSLFRYRGSRTRALVTLLVPVALVAVWFPLQMGTDWVDDWVSLFSLVAPLVMVIITVPDSFAGERERHTLETLLASRLPDRAIFLGKLLVAVGMGFVMTVLVLALALITVNAAHWEGHVALYSPTIFLVDLAVAFVVALLVASAGILLSLRASTVQEAQQTLGVVVMVPPMVIGLVLLAFRDRIGDWLTGVSVTQVVLIIGGLLLAVSVILLLAASRRFQRNRLILG